MGKSLTERFRPLFYPQSVAVIGASMVPTKWGFGITHNIIQGKYHGALYPINFKTPEIMGRKAYKSVLDIPGPVDLAMVVVPPKRVLDAIKDCQTKKIGAAVIITAGFGEVGEDEARLQVEVVEQIRKTPDFVVIGPNCQGIMSTETKLYSQIIFAYPPVGDISIVSQSGNVGASAIHWGQANNIGFNKFVSSGNEAATTSEDLIEYYGEDPSTRVIMSYVEGLKDARRFLEVAKKVTPKKPVVMLKGGLTEAGAGAASSHTGSMAGESGIFEGACRQVGITLARDLDEFFYTAAAFLGQPLPKGNRVGIVTLGGGWGVLAADAAVREGLDVVPLSSETIGKLDEILESRWSHNNPVDLAASEGKNLLGRSLDAVCAADNIDGIIQLGIGFGGRIRQIRKNPSFLLADNPQLMDLVIERVEKNDLMVADSITELKFKYGKPIVSGSDSVVGRGVSGNVTLEHLSRCNHVVLQTPNRTARVFAHLARYGKYRAAIESESAPG